MKYNRLYILLTLLLLSLVGQTYFLAPPQIQSKIDVDGDKIADFSSFLEKRTNIIDELIVNVKAGYPSTLISTLAELGFPVQKEWRHFNTLSVKGNFADIDKILTLPWIDLVEEQQTFTPQMLYSSSQMNARGKLWDLGLTGKGQTVAILDTGIDDTHPFFKNRIISWADFVGQSVLVTGDNYATPSDIFGHGTHVAGIIAGDGSSLNSSKVSRAGKLPPSGFLSFAGEIPRLSTLSDVEIGIDWGNRGVDSSAQSPITIYITTITDTDTLVVSKTTDTSGFDSLTFSLSAGKYFVWVSGGTENGFYDMWVNAPAESSLPSTSDGYPQYSGIAPEANIAAVKILDDQGNGDTSTFLDGLTWVLDNQKALNITVMNMSLGTSNIVSSIDNAVNILAKEGILPVVSAGNEGPTTARIGSPGSAALAVTVGAVNKFNEVAFYSSKGNPTENPTIKPDIVAPGGSLALASLGDETGYTDGYGVIYAADSNDRNYQAQDDDVVGYFGTSMAAPHISGLALLLIQRMKELGQWNTDEASTGTVKSAMLATTFEVANIGNNGGETFQGSVDPLPSIQRIGKDYYEGWGMVNAYAALSFIDRYAPLNTPIPLNFDLENPFIPNSYAYRINGMSGMSYTINLTVPSSVDADLIVFKSAPQLSGEPQILTNSLSSIFGQNESLNLNLTSNEDLIVVVKLVDGTTPSEGSLLIQSDFIPSMEIFSPTANQIVKSDSIRLEFNSTTSYAEVILNDVSYGLFQNGDILDSGLNDGNYTLQLIEKNSLNGQNASQNVSIGIDASPPEIISTNLQTLSVADIITINYTVSDNYAIDQVSLLFNNEIYSSSKELTGSFTVNTYNLPIGKVLATLQVKDSVGYVTSQSRVLTLNHSLFLEDLGDLVFEGQDLIQLTWDAGALNPDSYQIEVNGSLAISETWNGAAISFELKPDPSLSFPVYNISIIIKDSIGNSLSRSSLISFIDSSAPEVSYSLPSKEYDLTDGIPQITLSIWDFGEVTINFDLGAQVDFKIVSEVRNGRSTNVTYEITGAEIGLNLNLNITVSDSAGHTTNVTKLIQIRDLTRPTIFRAQSVTSEVGVSKIISWEYREAFPESITLKTEDGTVLKSEKSPQPDSIFEYDLKELTVGEYTLRLTVNDLGGNTFSTSVKVVITERTENSTTSGGLPFPLFSLIILPLIRRKRNF